MFLIPSKFNSLTCLFSHTQYPPYNSFSIAQPCKPETVHTDYELRILLPPLCLYEENYVSVNYLKSERMPTGSGLMSDLSGSLPAFQAFEFYIFTETQHTKKRFSKFGKSFLIPSIFFCKTACSARTYEPYGLIPIRIPKGFADSKQSL